MSNLKSKNDNHLILNSKPENSGKWYIVHTYSGHENRVLNELETRIKSKKLTEKIHQLVIPTQEKIKIVRGKKNTVREKLFPGYILVNMIMTDDAWLTVRSTPGVTSFVGIGRNPTPISLDEVNSILQFSQQKAPKFKSNFSVGEAIKIADGPFAEMLGTIDKIDEDKGRLTVLVSIFGRETPVDLDLLQIKKI
jgi:transcriptional antiterminator NusG